MYTWELGTFEWKDLCCKINAMQSTAISQVMCSLLP